MRISHIAPFAVSAALSRACGRGRRVSARSARRFGCSNDAAGHRTAISRSGEAFGDLSGAVDAYGYNLRSEVVSARRTKGGASVRGFDEDFSYDPIGNRIATTNYTETGSAIVSEYSANNLNQYTSRTVPGVAAVRGFADANATVTVNENPTWRLGEYFYGSDEFDNSAAPVDAALVTTAALASPTNGPDEVASVTSRVHIAKTPQLFEYDLDGNQTLVTTKTGTWSVTYNGENRPIRWMRINVADTNGQTMISMNFDHQGRRRLYLETAADGSTNRLDRFTYDNYLCVARNRWQPDGTSATDRFFWDPTEPVATRPLVFYQPNASPQLYAVDGNKNISELVSFDDGTISAHYEYAPFGEVILSSGNLAITNPFRFSSEYADDALALVYFNYRHLEPVTGRWLCRDPIEEFGGLGLYLLVANCPLCFQDAIGTGVFWEYFKDGCVLAASLVTIAGAAMLGGASSWSGVGAVVGWSGVVIGADQFAKSVWRIRDRMNGADPSNDTLITWSVKKIGRSVTHEVNPMFEIYVDSVYFGVETVTECATGIAVIKATSVAVKTTARASALTSRNYPFRVSDNLVLAPVSNGTMIGFQIESVAEVTIKAGGAVRHAVSSGSVFAIDLFNWYNDWTWLLMRYGDYKE